MWRIAVKSAGAAVALCMAVHAETVVHYHFDDGQNGGPVVTATDVGPHGLDGTGVGILSYSNEVAPHPWSGPLSLDATADFDYINIAHDSVLESPEVTVEVLARPRYDAFTGGGSSPHFMVNKSWSAGPGAHLATYGLAYEPQLNRFEAFIGYGDGTGLRLLTDSLFDDGAWYHVAMTYETDLDRSLLALYVDSILAGCQIAPPRPLFFDNLPLTIGAANFIADDHVYRRNFIGQLDEVRVSNRALRAEDLTMRDRVFFDSFELNNDFSGCTVVS